MVIREIASPKEAGEGACDAAAVKEKSGTGGRMAYGNKLTPKQDKYARARVRGLSQREAYKESYSVKRMSDASIDKEACVLEANPKVSQRIRELQEKAAAEAVATAQQVLQELTDIGFGRKAYPGYTITGDEIERKPSMTARLKALELLGKHHKLYTDRVEEKGDMTLTVVIGEDIKEFAE